MIFELSEIGAGTEVQCDSCIRRARYRLVYRTRTGSTDFNVCPSHAVRAAEDLYQKLQRRMMAPASG